MQQEGIWILLVFAALFYAGSRGKPAAGSWSSASLLVARILVAFATGLAFFLGVSQDFWPAHFLGALLLACLGGGLIFDYVRCEIVAVVLLSVVAAFGVFGEHWSLSPPDFWSNAHLLFEGLITVYLVFLLQIYASLGRIKNVGILRQSSQKAAAPSVFRRTSRFFLAQFYK